MVSTGASEVPLLLAIPEQQSGTVASPFAFGAEGFAVCLEILGGHRNSTSSRYKGNNIRKNSNSNNHSNNTCSSSLSVASVP